ncbi:MAG: hypothetical protein RLN88_11205 [Ekhidna sp.]|uniref:hypothetical protein n=1 Tax=Ekhidna sp. TaxID=2608089 RepID=UPI0032EF518B
MNEYANKGSNKTLVVIIIVVLVAVVFSGIWYFAKYKPEQEAKEKARLEQLAKQETEKKRREQEAQNKARYDQLIENADSEVSLENWESARSLYSEASAIFQNEQYPKDQLVMVNAKLDEIAELEARKAAGIVETVTSPTGRFYIIASSSIDEDLAMDYARKLAKSGINVKLVKHHANELPFHGVSLGDYATWDQAVNASSSFTGFESGVWILKY